MNRSNIAAAINAAHTAVEQAKRDGARHAIECGRLLAEAKEVAPHGSWDQWLKENCQFSPRTAQLYMRVHRHVRDDPAKAQRVADLSLRDIAKALAEPKPKKDKSPQPRDLLEQWYGADAAAKIRFAQHLFHSGEIKLPQLRKMLADAGMDPQTSARAAAELLAEYVPADKHKRLILALKALGSDMTPVIAEVDRLRAGA